MRIITAILILALCAGCGKKKSPKPEGITELSKFATTDLPVPPPVADVKPTGQDVAGAKSDVESAQKNVQTVLNVARASDAPVAKQAVPPLSSADSQLTTAILKLNAATSKIEGLEATIKKSEEAHANDKKIMRADIDRLNKACELDSAELNKQIAGLQKENEDLKNEDTRKARHRLMGVGVLLLLVGIGGIVAIFAVGFMPGKIIGAMATPMGLLCIWFSANFDKIMWWTEVSIIATTLCFLAYVAWKLFWQDPPKKKGVNGKETSAA